MSLKNPNFKLVILVVILLTSTMITHAQTILQEGRIVMPTTLDFAPKGKIIERKPFIALKTNLLYDVVSIINIGVDVPIGKRWSVGGDWIFPWWLNNSHQNAIEIGAGDIEGRYWFESMRHTELLTGWFIGVYGTAGYYDWERDRDGKQGEFWGGGISGGFAHEIGRNLRLEYAVGLGVADTQYRKYDAIRDCTNHWVLLREGHYNKTMWGVTKIEVSLVWMLNKLKRE